MTPRECSEDIPEDELARMSLAESVLGLEFGDPELLRRALTHPSHTADDPCHEDYQRLEFLGDAVIGFFMAYRLYAHSAALPEGRMSKLRSSFVAGASLACLAEELGLTDAVITGDSIGEVSGRVAQSVLADVFEALVAAVYLDRGMDATLELLDTVFTEERLRSAIERATESDPKSLLQERTQARGGQLPEYEIVGAEGPPHDRTFRAVVRVGGVDVGTGSAHSKKEAEKVAARAALQALEEVEASAAAPGGG
jgi:ribonuclease-3